MTGEPGPPLELRLDGEALAANFAEMERLAGVPAIAAVKADGYGLGAREVAARLWAAGARAFAVSSWAEAQAGAPWPGGAALLVFHGFRPQDERAAHALPLARPVLSTARQCAAWAAAFPGRAADLMVDTGMNRLGLGPGEAMAAGGIPIDTLHSHLAAADRPDDPLTPHQLGRFREAAAAWPAGRRALANSAGVFWGARYAFDAVRPGLHLYGGPSHPAARPRRVAFPRVEVLQRRRVAAGEGVGYGQDFVAPGGMDVAIVHAGYADGLPRLLAGHLAARAGGRTLPLVGRISMDLMALDSTGVDLAEGDMVDLDLDLGILPSAAGISAYELLTGLSRRYRRRWT